MNGYEALRSLPLAVADCELVRHERATSSGFDRVTTEIRLHGDDSVGVGEDVTYEASLHDDLHETGAPPLSGEYEFETFSEIVGDLDLFPGGAPEREAFYDYRRWGFESAALDLALQQAETTLAEALDASYDPVRFLASTRLGEPPTLDRIEAFQSRLSDAEFKLDPTDEWTADVIDQLSSAAAVRVLDLKGHYHGTTVDQEANPELYRTLFEAFPDAVFEDPAITDETEPILDGEFDRISWDAPVHDVADLKALPDSGWLNVKPSRFGSVESLLAAFEHCADEHLNAYVGGQFELGAGRGHLQALASVFCPDGPNDVAPIVYNDPTLPESLPASPLHPTDGLDGLAWSFTDRPD